MKAKTDPATGKSKAILSTQEVTTLYKACDLITNVNLVEGYSAAVAGIADGLKQWLATRRAGEAKSTSDQ